MTKNVIKGFLIAIVLLGISISMTGCGHEHIWEAATCTAPKTCTECNETEGEPLGHTTGVGFCTNCNRYQGQDIVINILKKVEEGNKKCQSAINLVAFSTAFSYQDMYNNCVSGVKDFEEAVIFYNTAIEMCGSYTELLDLKKDLEALVNYPEKPKSSNKEDIYSFVSRFEVYVKKLETMDNTAALLESNVKFIIESPLER